MARLPRPPVPREESFTSPLRGPEVAARVGPLLGVCFAVAFLVKMPLVPFHGWLPDGYKAMPIEVLMVF